MDISIFVDMNKFSLNDKVNLVKNYLYQIWGFGITNLITAPNEKKIIGGTFFDHFYWLSPEKVTSSYIIL